MSIQSTDMEVKSLEGRPEVDMLDILKEKFSTGRGTLCLSLGMTDEIILSSVKHAMSLSEGKAFTVIPMLDPARTTNA